MTIEIEIEELGARGDGIARLETERGDALLYVPFTLPGERVAVGEPKPAGQNAWRAEARDILAPSPLRAEPPCPHFGVCGGCALQHLDAEAGRAWKAGIVETALARHGFEDVPMRPVVATPPGARRRAVLTAVRRKAGLALGFHRRGSNEVIDIAGSESPVCPVMRPEIEALLPSLAELFTRAFQGNRRTTITVTAAGTGLDILAEADTNPGRRDREQVAAFSADHRIARFSWQNVRGGGPETLIQNGPVQMTFADVPVDLPSGGFLQASEEGEVALQAVVREAAGSAATRKKPRAADLYAGCGTFTFPLARAGFAVHAVEGAKAAVHALDAAARAAGLGGPVTAERRDLERRALKPADMEGLDLVVFDPPRAGARTQAQRLAGSAVPVVVAISCNPATFARDARLLADGGYRLESVTPVDQFLWSPHVELAAVFRRGG